jgi:hypothetical protein
MIRVYCRISRDTPMIKPALKKIRRKRKTIAGVADDQSRYLYATANEIAE